MERLTNTVLQHPHRQPEGEPVLALVDRREVLDFAASAGPRICLKKDVWIVWTLETLFGGPLGAHLVFKGGPSHGMNVQAAIEAPRVRLVNPGTHVSIEGRIPVAVRAALEERGQGHMFLKMPHSGSIPFILTP